MGPDQLIHFTLNLRSSKRFARVLGSPSAHRERGLSPRCASFSGQRAIQPRFLLRSEERRVGKEGRTLWAPHLQEKKFNDAGSGPQSHSLRPRRRQLVATAL